MDQDAYVLDEIVQVRRNTKTAKRLVVHLLKKQGLVPKRIIADKLRSYGAARRQVMPGLATIRLDLLSRPKPFRSRQIRSPRCPDPILPPSRDYPTEDGRAATRLKSTLLLPCARTSKNVTVPSMVVIRTMRNGRLKRIRTVTVPISSAYFWTADSRKNLAPTFNVTYILFNIGEFHGCPITFCRGN